MIPDNFCRRIHLVVALLFALATVSAAQLTATNLALHANATASSTFESRYAASNAVDGVVSDGSRWLSRKGDNAQWLELDLGAPRAISSAHVYSGWEDGDAASDFTIDAWADGTWQQAAAVSGNTAQALAVKFTKPVITAKIRFRPGGAGPARIRELALFAAPVPLGTGVKLATDSSANNDNGAPVKTNQHLIALNQVGFETVLPKRFTVPLTADGTKFELHRTPRVEDSTALFTGVIRNHIGDFSTFKPADASHEYVITISGGALEPGQSDPFIIRRDFYKEAFWQTAIDFMIDCRSVVGTHPSAYGGGPWRDTTYYSFEAPSLIMLWLAAPERISRMPVQMNWAADKARVLSPEFKFDANNPHSTGVMDAVRRYYTELEPPKTGAPDALQLVHWGLGYYLVNPATRDPSGDPLPRQIHSQTVEQFAFLLHAWPQLKQWFPQGFYDRCRDFTFQNWKTSGCESIDPLWHPKTYMTPEQMKGPNPTGGSLHPYKGRHAPGHSILPNLLMYEVALREKRDDAQVYMKAAQTQAQWVIENIDWTDPRTTKGQRMSEHKTIPGLVWFLHHYPNDAPAGLKAKIADWARVAVQRSENIWDFRRYDLGEHWTIPKLNETGNLVSFTACALAASWVVDDANTKRRLEEIAIAQMDNVFGRNPRFAAAP
ncbi:MAG TPA: discoidin domain-containing protein, partial [Candidatus Acidoferrum sp.]|nr:discoidin domain-containing protein [Candidatus Acidoferrum sp.]